MNKRNNALQCIGAIIVCELAGIVGSVFTAPAIRSGWYTALIKPELAPPNWVFGPAWTTLYALMGIAVFLVWNNHSQMRRWAIELFVVQLALNILWSFMFFGLRSVGGALVEIVFLWLAILVTTIAFSKISKPAAWLLAPYIAWVSFAVYLNYGIWSLN